MPSTREIRRRINSAKNIAKITRAMEMVAAARMKRAQSAVVAGRPYAAKIAEVIQNLAARVNAAGEEKHPLLVARPVKNITVIMITSDRGLMGALNTNVIRRTTRFILNEANAPTSIVAIGRKGRDFMVRYGRPLIAEYVNYGDRPGIKDIYPIARVAMDEYTSGRADAVYLVYTDFVNTLIQRPTVFRLLPLDVSQLEEGVPAPGENQPVATDDSVIDYEYEPSANAILSQIIPRYVEVRIYQALLEHLASQHSAQMVAMRNATDNAKDVIQDLTLAYNKLRQANITKEIIEISSGAAALTG